MTLTDSIKTDPLLFDKLLAPLQAPLAECTQHPTSQSAGKLGFCVFVRLLLFRLFARIRSARDLRTDVQSNPIAQALGFSKFGLSTFHDAFVRYPVAWFARLVQHVQAAFPVAPLDELAALGQLWCGDSSWWPLPRQLGWLAAQGLTGVRLHLGLSLNTLCAASFILSYDAAPGLSERTALLALAQAGITYILDRGYVSLPFYRELMERRCHFVIRERNNLQWRTLCALESVAHPVLAGLSGVSDQIVKLPRDPAGTLLRLVCFTCAGHQFRLITNRFDLHTHEVVRLYAWRWQVELLFRAWKHTLGDLHLLNLSAAGIAIQFHVLLLAALLWALLQQTAESLAPAPTSTPAQPSRTITGSLSQLFQRAWRLRRQPLRLCANCLALPFSGYLKERLALAT